MLSLKEFKEFSLTEEKQTNAVGGNYIIGHIIDTDTGRYNEVWEFTDDDKLVSHGFYKEDGTPYDGKQGEK